MSRIVCCLLALVIGLMPVLNAFGVTVDIQNKTTDEMFVSGMVGTTININPIRQNLGKATLISDRNSVSHLLLKQPDSKSYYDNILVKVTNNEVYAVSLYKKAKVSFNQNRIIVEKP